ncbi:hypothetical protein [Synechocystis sp. CACIAM 05]|uniref:hypothetical protein n=1 Tax=Synechocystis sp. CACIAM 05 TaxID=1933929 RepID=UPI001F2BFC0A|nr:hypothetical protein [Synechocystis sp. CACIAM 05]
MIDLGLNKHGFTNYRLLALNVSDNALSRLRLNVPGCCPGLVLLTGEVGDRLKFLL